MVRSAPRYDKGASTLGQCGKAVRGDVVGNAEGFTRDAVQEIAFDGFGRCKGDRMDKAVNAVPVLAELAIEGVDLCVFGDIALEYQLAVELGREFGNAVEEAFVLISEGEFRAFTMTGLGDAIGDGAVAQQSCKQDAFSG
jgi:hypothetical protein